MMESILMTVLCLSGWLILPSCPLRQYHFVNEPLTWNEAQSYCRETYTDLATIESMTEVNQLIDTVSSSGNNSEVWIGLYNENDWRWSDGFTGSRAEYRNWLNGEPTFYSASEFCAAATSSAQWFDAPCLNEYPVICNNGTQLDPEFIVVNKTMTWSSAQKYCRENFTDLATVRNETDTQQLQKLTYDGAWIGLFKDPNFYWSDGSSFFFHHWDDVLNPFGSSQVMCGVTSLYRSGKWKFSNCDSSVPFVCYSIPVKKQVVKLRIKLDDSSVDPNDPAVKAELLKKLQERLKEKGVSGVTLKWREQPDGKVWHKEVPQGTTPAC